MDGNWKLVKVHGQAKTDKASGNKLVFEGECQRNMFDGVLAVRHAEQFGKLTLKQGSKLYFDAEVKIIRNDRRKKDGEQPTCVIQVVPTTRMSPKPFGDLYGAIDTHFEAEFVDTGDPEASAGDGRPPADDENDNVVPGSTADHMVQNARAAARKRAPKSTTKA